jgi:hypothetical protein
MYIRLAQGKVNDPTKMDEMLALVRQGFASLKQRPGFQSAYMGGNRENGRGLLISFWDTEEHACWVHPAPPPGAGATRAQAIGLQEVEPFVVFEVSDQM